MKWKTFLMKTLLFLGLYLSFTLAIVPPLAMQFGRSPVKHMSPTNFLTIVLNRNYVGNEYNQVFRVLKLNSDAEIFYLDACFPFIEGFPLPPHLSHNDGKKIDLSFIYENEVGQIVNKQKSRSGYGVFVKPQDDEINQTEICKQNGYFQYDYSKYLSFGEINPELQFSVKGNRKLLSEILRLESVEKVFIEPHLKQRLGLHHPKLRFHGCGAVRHDDHIHVQFK